MFDQEKLIDSEDLDLVYLVSTCREAFEIIQKSFDAFLYNRFPVAEVIVLFAPEKFDIGLRRAPSVKPPGAGTFQH